MLTTCNHMQPTPQPADADLDAHEHEAPLDDRKAAGSTTSGADISATKQGAETPQPADIRSDVPKEADAQFRDNQPRQPFSSQRATAQTEGYNENSSRQTAKSSHQIPGKASTGKSSVRVAHHWYCCDCGYGPHDAKYHHECTGSICWTSHKLCKYCPVESVRIYTKY